VTKRNQIVRQRSRLKNIIQSILHSHLIPSCPHADLCGASGRAWLLGQVLPEDEQLAIERHLREFDRLGEDLKVIERDLARSALGDEGVKRLMTIPGVDMVALATMWAKRQTAHAYNIKSHRDQERRWVERAETAYARFVAGWNPRGPKRARTGAATEVRR